MLSDYPPLPIPQRPVTESFTNRSESSRGNFHAERGIPQPRHGQPPGFLGKKPRVEQNVTYSAQRPSDDIDGTDTKALRHLRHYKRDIDWPLRQGNDAARAIMPAEARTVGPSTNHFDHRKIMSSVQPSIETANPQQAIIDRPPVKNHSAQQTADHGQDAQRVRNFEVVGSIRMQNEPHQNVSKVIQSKISLSRLNS